jgi:hypothetical protein
MVELCFLFLSFFKMTKAWRVLKRFRSSLKFGFEQSLQQIKGKERTTEDNFIRVPPTTQE